MLICLMSPPPVSGERRFWMMSRITLPLTPISGCHPMSEKSWGKKKRSWEIFATCLARTGRSHWILLAEKWLMRETTSTSITTSKIIWFGLNQDCKGRFVLLYSHAQHVLLLKCLHIRLDETLKAMNSDSTSKSPKYSERRGGRQTLGGLVNPNIMQSAPEVGLFLFWQIYLLVHIKSMSKCVFSRFEKCLDFEQSAWNCLEL